MACECGACGEKFGTLELFDAHQHWDRRGEWKLSCSLPPGLVRDARGTWQTPEGLARRAADAARGAATFAAMRAGRNASSGLHPSARSRFQAPGVVQVTPRLSRPLKIA